MKHTQTFCLLLFSIIGFTQTISLQTFGTGFTKPVDIEHPVNDSRLFVVEQGGVIKILNSNGTTNSTPFLTISSLISTGGERGLLGLAFHPNYATNGFFYINYHY
jgi:glucose/arabinose dehydrogenase